MASDKKCDEANVFFERNSIIEGTPQMEKQSVFSSDNNQEDKKISGERRILSKAKSELSTLR